MTPLVVVCTQGPVNMQKRLDALYLEGWHLVAATASHSPLAIGDTQYTLFLEKERER